MLGVSARREVEGVGERSYVCVPRAVGTDSGSGMERIPRNLWNLGAGRGSSELKSPVETRTQLVVLG